MQFFNRIDKTNPEVNVRKDFINTENVPIDVAKVLKIACYDCHSHETKYPWYTNVNPVSWWLKGHIDHGRKQLNFSTWQDYSEEDRKHAKKEVIEVVEEKRMPLTPYWIMHPAAKISPEQRKLLTDFFQSQLELI